MPDIRLVALDLDGTVFNDEKEITPRTLEAIRAAIAKGVDVIPATGRVASGVPEAFLRIPGVRYALTSNGASVVELSTGKPLVNLPFDAALASDIYDIVAATCGAMGIFIGGKAYTDYFGANDGLALMPPALRRYLRDSRIVVDDMHAVFAAHPHEVEKFSITYRDNAARDAAWLENNGYHAEKVQPVDLFPRTKHCETVVLLSKGEVDSKKIRVEFSLEDMDMSEFQDGATYPQIKEYVLEHTGLKVSNLYISQIKRKCGIGVGKNYNLPKSEDSRQPQCPQEKEKAIREAFKYFGMI